MKASGWLRHGLLQSAPGEFPLTWYAAGLVVIALFGAAAVGAAKSRREPGREGLVDPTELIDAVEEPLALLRDDGTVLAANETFGALVGGEDPGTVEDAIDAQPELEKAVETRNEEVVTLQRSGETRQYRVRTYPVGSQSPRMRIVLLHDVTDHHERRAQLEAENEQLDQFASLISHDLRNPLDVAIGRTNAVAEAVDDPELTRHLSRVRESHQRMKQIITDVLALAREGHSIGNTECVPLETAAMDAWSHVDTDGAELSVSTQLVIEADGERLTRIFENLFRNAVEHGSTSPQSQAPGDAVEHGSTGSRAEPDDTGGASSSEPSVADAPEDAVEHGGRNVRIEVGALEDGSGFYVADDGEGIDSGERTAVLEPGYTGGEDGTGLGLAIVSGIAEAHGWGVRVTDSDDGGARFEFSGVEEANEALARGSD